MDLYQRQQFDFFLHEATERLVERLVQRYRGPVAALARCEQSPSAHREQVREFVDAVFDDFLLANADGACFVLRGLCKKRAAFPDFSAPHDPAQDPANSATDRATVTVEERLVAWAKALFFELLLDKSLELLQQQSSYQPVSFGET